MSEISSKNQESSEGSIIKVIAGMMAGILLVISVLMVLDSLRIISLSKLIPLMRNDTDTKKSGRIDNTIVKNTDVDQLPGGAIGSVGEEIIYKSDYDVEYTNYPDIFSKTKAVIQAKLAKDSIILQAAAKDKMIVLDSSVYNSPSKSYQKRIQKIAEVEKIIKDNQSEIKGEIVSIWFYNPNVSLTETAEMRERAKNKITPLYEAVKSKKSTLKDAGLQLKNDVSLSQIDKNYRINAYVSFQSGGEKNIFTDLAVFQRMNTLQVGELSELMLVKDIDYKTRGQRDAGYMFMRLTGKKDAGMKADFAQWYAGKEKLYEKKFN